MWTSSLPAAVADSHDSRKIRGSCPLRTGADWGSIVGSWLANQKSGQQSMRLDCSMNDNQDATFAPRPDLNSLNSGSERNHEKSAMSVLSVFVIISGSG